MKRFFYALALAMALGGCASFGRFTPEAKSVLNTIWDAAKLLCLVANAEKAGTTVDQVADSCCRTRAEIEPFLEPAIAAKRAGAVKAGMAPGPLTPANAEPQLKSDPNLEQRK